MLYVGIDNGESGGIAALHDDGQIYTAEPMPKTIAELVALMRELAEFVPGQASAVAVLEHAQAFPRMGRSGAFNYGKGYGAVQVALYVAGIPYDIVQPAKWQQAMQCLSKGEKNVTKRRAEQLFPRLTITHALADALLIAEFCRRVRTGYGEKGQGQQGRKRGKQAPGADEAPGGRAARRAEGTRAAQTRTAVAGPAGHGARPRQAAR